MGNRFCFYIAHEWRLSKVMWMLIAIEIPLVIAVLALFGIADPDTYRTKLWQNGSDQGFNSNPNEILYDYANYRPVHIPVVWSMFATKFNLIISVLTVFILLVKAAMFVLNTFIPIVSVFIHCLLIALYAVSVRNQITPDLSNTEVPNLSRNMPWYLAKGCSFATQKNYGYCMQARASFGVTVVILALYVVYLAFSFYSIKPSAAERAARQADYDDEIELKQARYTMDPDAGLTKEEKWEKNRQIFLNLPKTPNTPQFGHGMPAMTPRTTAFTQLNGGAGPSTPGFRPGTGASGPGGRLPLRQQFEQYGEVRVPDPI